MNLKHKQFMLLYEKHHLAFNRYCQAQGFGIINSKDLMSESLLRAYEGFDSLKNLDAFLSFLIGISRNIIKSKLRRKKLVFRQEESHKHIADDALSPAEKLDVQLLYEALHKLSASQKEAVILFEISGYSIREIAELQGVTESAVKSRLKRGREKLASLLKDEHFQTVSHSEGTEIVSCLIFLALNS